jgi:hypothetical protein
VPAAPLFGTGSVLEALIPNQRRLKHHWFSVFFKCLGKEKKIKPNCLNLETGVSGEAG